MSLTTTTTATYDLTKYSRAYSHSTNPSSAQGELEWQHFANPVIHLTLDTKKSREGRLESLRLRIIWKFSAGADAMDLDQNEVVFEDLDLVTYSAVPSFQAPQGMPLKAVYQDAVVGLRYQHPRVAPPGQSPQYRRFQVTFQDEAAATAFIDRIRFVCPCKVNGGPPAPRVARPTSTTTQGRPQLLPASQNPMHISTPDPRAPGSTLRYAGSTVPPGNPAPSAAVRRTNTTVPPSSSPAHNWLDTVCGSQYPGQGPNIGGISHLHNTPTATMTQAEHSSSRPTSATTVSSAVAHHSFSEPAPRPTPTPSEQTPDVFSQTSGILRSPLLSPRKAVMKQGSSSDVEASLPSSSFPTSSPSPASRPLPQSSPMLMPPPPLPPQASIPPSCLSQQPTDTPVSSAPPRPVNMKASEAPSANTTTSPTSTLKSDIDARLRDSGGLYELSKDQLERLVAEVVREEGFAELMNSLDGMWKIKGLVGIGASSRPP